MAADSILVVDDERLIRWALRERLEDAGYRVREAQNGAEARAAMSDDAASVVLLDYKLPDVDGVHLLTELKAAHPDAAIIMMTGHSSVQLAVEAMKQGAFHYLNKPVNFEELKLLVEKALETSALRHEVLSLRESQSKPYSFDRMVGESPPMKTVKVLLRKIATSRAATVLLRGESGTGKDVAAKTIHYNSDRASRPFVNITCSAIPDTLLESELFGHERGSFTDAKEQKKGLFEVADGGTLFLDEIGEMSPTLQSKLLRVLEERTFRRVGGSVDIKVDVRVVAATNRNLEEAVQQRSFRNDLFFRLQVMPVVMPPLRERSGDVPRLAQFFVDYFSREFASPVRRISPESMQLLDSYAWPGNVRELKNAIERAMLLAEGSILNVADFSSLHGATTAAANSETFTLPPGGVELESLERDLVRQALERSGGNQTRAAALLGLNRDQIRYRIEKFGMALRRGG